jgi:hypothetical protein
MARQSKKLNVRVVDDNENCPYVLIEGNKTALESLAHLILGHVRGQKGCGRQIFPQGPGSAYFSKSASHGIYLHLLPCDHPTDASDLEAGRKPRH